jgi:hypothetical protein
MDNIDQLVDLWGFEHFDYLILIYDDSMGLWNERFDWWPRVVGVSARTQAKMWYYKRFALPWVVKGYRYVHFADSDVASPADQPFHLREYEDFIAKHRAKAAQAAVKTVGR